ncbi:MAG: hypothetical protein LM583_07665 [Desulfurococcaceae archaeon]|jgi:hypothetical protein|nr:hypothetical protein [Desulfurococcaceae archaeon]
MNEKKIKASYMDHVNNEAKLKYLALTMLMLIMLGAAFIVIGRHTINVCGESNYFAKYLGQLFEAMESLLLCTPLIIVIVITGIFLYLTSHIAYVLSRGCNILHYLILI